MEDFNQNKALETLGTMPHELFNRRISLIGNPEAIEKLKSGLWHIERHCLYTTVDVSSEVEIDNMFSEQPIENCPFSIFENGKLIMSPPKMLYPNRKLEFSCKWNEVLGCGTMLKVELHGIRTLDALK